MRKTRAGAAAFVAAMIGAVHPGAVASDDAALDLQPKETAGAPSPGERPLRIFGELAVGRLEQRHGLPSEDSRRASLDLTWNARLAPQWRAVLSNRDFVTPDDVREIAVEALAHRVVLSNDAWARNAEPVDIVRRAIDRVPAPSWQ